MGSDRSVVRCDYRGAATGTGLQDQRSETWPPLDELISRSIGLPEISTKPPLEALARTRLVIVASSLPPELASRRPRSAVRRSARSIPPLDTLASSSVAVPS